MRNFSRLAVFVKLKEVKLAFCSHFTRITVKSERIYAVDKLCAHISCVVRAVHVFHTAKESYNTSRLRPPRKNREGRNIGNEQQIGAAVVYARCIERNAVLKCSFKFVRHDSDVFEAARNVAECESNEFYVIFLNKFQYFLW